MQNREVFIASTKDQCRYKVVTDAATLGELQDVLTRNEGVLKKVGNQWVPNTTPVDFSGMSFTEGTTKLTCVDRSSAIPEYGTRQGQLCPPVFLLTNTNKQIKSGTYSRKELYQKVKEYHLEEIIKEQCGTNFTRVSNTELAAWVASAESHQIGGIPENPVVESTAEPEAPQTYSKPLPDIKTAPHPEAVEWQYAGIKYMVKTGMLYAEDVAVIADLTTALYHRLVEERPKLSDKDIDDIIDSL